MPLEFYIMSFDWYYDYSTFFEHDLAVSFPQFENAYQY